MTMICVLAIIPAFAGGILTNTNQSASYVRMLARDASTDVDAVYFNPAALTLLTDGFYISLNNQSIFQNKEVTNSYPYLNNSSYLGEVSAPFFPGVYAAYKKGKFAFSFGLNPIGGGGGATFSKGLPSFEVPASNLVPALASQGITAYSADINFEGTSVFWGLQVGVSYALSDYFSIYGGGRYIMAKNTYNGEIKNMTVYSAELPGEGMLAEDFLNGLGDQATAGAASLNEAGTGMQGLIDFNLGGLTLQEAEDVGAIDAATHAQLAAGLTQIGVDPTLVTIAQGQGAFFAAAAGYTEAAAEAYSNAESTKDVEVDAEQNGTSFTPIVGASLVLADGKLNIGVKYEFKSELELENTTRIDGSGLFPNGALTHSDMPGYFAAGFGYDASDKLKISYSFHTYFDQKANWDGREKFISKNFTENAIGLEYSVGDNLIISAGYLYAATGATDAYQTDLSYSLNSGTFGFGGQFKVNDNFYINLGALYTDYQDSEKIIRADQTTYLQTATESYYKDNFLIAFGVDLKIF